MDKAVPQRHGDDRGGDADRPSEISRRGWRDVLLRVWHELTQDNISLVAAGVAFFGLLAAFPAISALVLLYGLVADPAEVQRHLDVVRGVMPGDAFNIISQQATSVASQGAGKLGLGLIISLALAIWSANKGTSALVTALNIAYEEEEQRSFITINLTTLAFTLGGLLFFLVIVTLIAAIPAAVELLRLSGHFVETTLLWMRWLVIALVMMLALAVLYRYAPSRARAKMRWVNVGAIVASLVWIASSIGFTVYVANFADYNKTFGSLGAVVILLMWFYISAYVVCAGAELNAELERQTLRDTTTGPEKPIGERGAYVADNKADRDKQKPSEPGPSLSQASPSRAS